MTLRCDYQPLATDASAYPTRGRDGQNENEAENFEAGFPDSNMGDGGTKRGLQQRQWVISFYRAVKMMLKIFLLVWQWLLWLEW